MNQEFKKIFYQIQKVKTSQAKPRKVITLKTESV